MIGAADERYGSVDVLVNCVGWDQLMFFTETTPELWEKIIRLNYVGVLNCTKAALAYMVPQQRGSIVAISSDASRQGEPREAVYGGVKAAINSFMKTIAKENGRAGIRCNVVCPGVTIPEDDDEVGETSMWHDKDSMFTPSSSRRWRGRFRCARSAARATSPTRSCSSRPTPSPATSPVRCCRSRAATR